MGCIPSKIGSNLTPDQIVVVGDNAFLPTQDPETRESDYGDRGR